MKTIWIKSNLVKLVLTVLLSLTAIMLFHCSNSAASDDTEYVITFETNGGTAVPPKIVKAGSLLENIVTTKVGHRFEGWFIDQGFTTPWNFSVDTVSQSINLYAKWAVLFYDISFITNGGSPIASAKIPYGSLVTKPQEPVKIGHRFVGWYKNSLLTVPMDFTTEIITQNLTLYAKWEVKTYPVYFKSTGGTAVKEQTIPHGGLLTEPTAPTKIGFTFNSWCKDSLLTESWNFQTDLVTDTLSLYAKWTVKTCTVTFDSKGGSSVKGEVVNHGALVTEPQNPTKNGFYFQGWCKEDSCVNSWDFGNDIVTEAITLYAKWTTVPTYTVKFDSKGGTAVSTQNVTTGSKLKVPIPPVKLGYRFDGWYKESSCVNKWDFDSDSVTSDITLYAKWIFEKFVVAFNSQGGSDVDSQFVDSSAFVMEPIEPTRAGYTFEGWFKEAECLNKWDFSNSTVTSNVILYAKWKINYHRVIFDSKGGSFVKNDWAKHDSLVTKPADPRKGNYSFGGWFKETECINKWDFTVDVVTAEITLFAQWIPNTFEVTFDSQGGSNVATVEVQYKNLVPEPPAPSKAGVSFYGWFSDPDCTFRWNFAVHRISRNITLYAKWASTEKLTVTFDSQGGSTVPSKEVPKNELLVRPINPTKNGTYFVTWYKEPACINEWDFTSDIVSTDITLYGKWSDSSFLLEFNTTLTEGTQVSLPVNGTVNVIVNWGDGNSTAFNKSGTIVHYYATEGTYIVSIHGTLTGFGSSWTEFFNRRKLQRVLSFGEIGLVNLSDAFYDAVNLVEVPNTIPSTVKDVSGMFQKATKFNQNINSWNTENITNMSAMFLRASSFNQPIGSWNTAQVTKMAAMFQHATAFNQPIGQWSTAEVTTMGAMFSDAASFNQPIGGWNTAKVTDMGAMFFRATSFNQDISEWNTSQVTEMQWMFFDAPAFNQPIGGWNTSKVTSMYEMFKQATSFNQPIGNWTTENVTSMQGVFDSAITFNQSIDGWNTSNVTNMSDMFRDATSFNKPLGHLNTSRVTDMSGMFSNATSFNQPIGNWNVEKVTNMYGLFSGASKFNQPLGEWNVSKVTSFVKMFKDASSFNQNIESWEVSKVTSLSSMFQGAQSFNQPLGKWKTAAVTDMWAVFDGATAFNQSIGSWNTSNVTIMAYMFSDAISFDEDIGEWDVSNVYSMNNMFRGATEFNQNIGQWKTEQLQHMENMFHDATLFNQDIGGWNTAKVFKMDSLFYDAKNFNQDLSQWNVKKIKEEPTDFDTGASNWLNLAWRPQWRRLKK